MTNRWQQRLSPKESLDPFPTPPWATRALFIRVLADLWPLGGAHNPVVHEPACGAGHMVKVLDEFTNHAKASDILDYGLAGQQIADYTDWRERFGRVDWTITNPPYSQAQKFIQRALDLSETGVAMLLRTTFLEGIARYETLFSKRPPAIVAPFTERVTMQRGRLRETKGSMIPYCWFVWYREGGDWPNAAPRIRWIPPCRAELTHPGDYDDPRKA